MFRQQVRSLRETFRPDEEVGCWAGLGRPDDARLNPRGDHNISKERLAKGA